MFKIKRIFRIARFSLDRFLDYLPLPLLALGDLLFLFAFLSDLAGKDFLPVADEIFLGLFLLYLNYYLLVRIYGIVSLQRIFHSQTLSRKQSLGMLSWEPLVRKSIRLIKFLRKEFVFPGAPDWLKQEANHLEMLCQRLKALSQRLEMVDQLFFTSSLNPQKLKSQMDMYERLSRISRVNQEEYRHAYERVKNQYQKCLRLLEQRNFLVQRIEWFYQMLFKVSKVIEPENAQKLSEHKLVEMVEQIREEFEKAEQVLKGEESLTKKQDFSEERTPPYLPH